MSLTALLTGRLSWDELAGLGFAARPQEVAHARLGRERRHAFRGEIKRLAEGGKHEPIVYFGRCGRHVKIGTTTNLRKRMESFYWGVDDVFAIVPGGRHLEVAYHERFATSRVREDGRAELFYLTWRLRLFVSRRRIDLWDALHSYGAATVVLCAFFWLGPPALILALATLLGGLGLQFMRPGWNYELLPPVRQVAQEVAAGFRRIIAGEVPADATASRELDRAGR